MSGSDPAAMTSSGPTPPQPCAPRVRWTVDGPIEVPEEPAAEATLAAPTAVEPAAAVEPPAAVEPAEAVPVGPAEVEVDDRAALRARLAERGLVRQEAAVRIRDVAGDAPPRPVPPAPAPAPPAVDGPPAVADEADVLEPEPLGPTAPVPCPSCRSTQEVSNGASGYRCQSCHKVWRWATCTQCAALSLTLARQESWRCTECGDYSRSWWRTPDGRREAPTILLRRQSDAARRRRERVQERARKRRWKVLVAGAALITATAAWALVASDRGVPATDRGATGAVCSTFAELRADLAAGPDDPAAVRTSLDDLAAAADEAIPSVRVAAERWAASGRPGDPTFAAAERDLAAACTAG